MLETPDTPRVPMDIYASKGTVKMRAGSSAGNHSPVLGHEPEVRGVDGIRGGRPGESTVGDARRKPRGPNAQEA